MRSFISLSICAVLVLGLSGCYVGDPKPWGRGYSSYDQALKSAPGPEARDIGYDYSNEKNETVIEDMRYAARDLVEKLAQKLTYSIDKVYLRSPANTSFYNSFDYLLRDELTRSGYILAGSPGDAGVTIDFVAERPETPACTGNRSAYQHIYLALVMDVVKKLPGESVGGFYEVPTYGYRKTNHVVLEVPPCASNCCLTE